MNTYNYTLQFVIIHSHRSFYNKDCRCRPQRAYGRRTDRTTTETCRTWRHTDTASTGTTTGERPVSRRQTFRWTSRWGTPSTSVETCSAINARVPIATTTSCRCTSATYQDVVGGEENHGVDDTHTRTEQ